MKTQFFVKIQLFTLAFAGVAAAFGSTAPPSEARPFPNKVFGCSIPAENVRDNPANLGSQPANALIVTTSESGGIPLQGSLATFSQVGNISGQGRCLQYSARLNALNVPEYSGWVFDVGMTSLGVSAICFRPPGSFCGNMSTAIAGGGLPPEANSFEVFPLVTGQTSVASAIGRLATNMNLYMEGPNSPPVRD